MSDALTIVEGEIVTWREALNRSDREILSLRAQLTSKTEAEALVRFQLATARSALTGNVPCLLTRTCDKGYSSLIPLILKLYNKVYPHLTPLGGGAGI